MYGIEVTIEPRGNQCRYTETRRYKTLAEFQQAYKDCCADRSVVFFEVI